MIYAGLLLSLAVLSQAGENQQARDGGAPAGAEIFFTLRTSELTIYDGMERFDCDNPVCGQLTEIDTYHRVARIRDGRVLGLRRAGEPALATSLGTLAEVSQGRLTQWPRRASIPPRTLPAVPNYNFVKAYQILTTDSYIGLWHRSGGGFGRGTILVLFDGGNSDTSSVPRNCGGHRILASVQEKIDILEVRSVLHLGEAVNLAFYDQDSKSIWLAKMQLLPVESAALDCRLLPSA